MPPLPLRRIDCRGGAVLYQGDCLRVLPTLADASVDAVICDPPYPMIQRKYGMLTEAEWWDLMMAVCKETRRILKPTGSAVFILQPNSRKVGSMRGWLWEFMAWACREWNMVQDAWWWNIAAIPLTKNDPNKLRSSLKACVWVGNPNCYRDASSVLWEESDANKAMRISGRGKVERNPQTRVNLRQQRRNVAAARGGTQPFNVLPFGPTPQAGSRNGHGAATPSAVARWWTRYICPPGGTILDPFVGSGTTLLAARKEGRRGIGIEQMPEYVETCKRRLAEVPE